MIALMVAGIAATILTLAVAGASLIAGYRRSHPFKVVGHNYDTGMTAIRWHDEPHLTHWVAPSTLDHLRREAHR